MRTGQPSWWSRPTASKPSSNSGRNEAGASECSQPAGSTLFNDMGFESADEHYGSNAMPGVSVFHKAADDSITRVASDFLGPGDSYCSVWHLFDLLHDGVGDWEAKFDYST